MKPCPVIALLVGKRPRVVREAAKRGVFAYIVDGDADELQSAIDITLQRFAEYQSLQWRFRPTGLDRAGERHPDGATHSTPTGPSRCCAPLATQRP